MNRINRILLFIFACFLVRILFVYGSYKVLQKNNTTLRYILSFIGLVIGISFIKQYKMNRTMGVFGGKAYWHPFRIVHGLNYIIFALLFALNYKKSYLILVFDVIIGLLVFLNNYLR